MSYVIKRAADRPTKAFIALTVLSAEKARTNRELVQQVVTPLWYQFRVEHA
jgi:hypothetical protein